MEKTMAIMVIALAIGTAAFAKAPEFKISAGGGGMVTGNFSTWKVDENIPGSLYRYNTAQISTTPYLFFDLTYLELNVGIAMGKLNADDTMTADPNFPARTLALRGGAYLKLPFTLSGMFTLFPLLGVDYDLYLLAKKNDDRDAKFPISTGTQDAKAMDALNTLWFNAGVGLDTFFTGHLFLRTELLYGLRLPNKMEEYIRDVRSDEEWMLGHGGNIKIALGYCF
jgi:hypothetical protein